MRPARRPALAVSLALALTLVLLAAPAQAARPLHHWPVALSIAPNPVRDRRVATITVRTLPGATCAAWVTYRGSGRNALSRGLHGPRVTDARGVLRWTWRPGTRYPGRTALLVRCARGTRHLLGTILFTIAA